MCGLAFIFLTLLQEEQPGMHLKKVYGIGVNDAGVAREGPGFDLAFLHIFFSKLCPWEGVC